MSGVTTPDRTASGSAGPVLTALSFDVEEYYHSQNVADTLDRRDVACLPTRVEPYTYRILEELAEARKHATFFVLGAVAERHPQLVRDICREGHEIACHGYGHQLVYRQAPGEFRDDVRRARCVLEDLISIPVVGYRAPTYSIVRRSLWALDVLAEEGYRYDSSIFPVRHHRYGIPTAPRYPFRLPSGLIEFPLSTCTILGIRLPIAGGGYFRLLPLAVSRSALRSFQRALRPAIFYLHPWDLDPEQPVGGLPVFHRWRQTVGARTAERKLARLLKEFDFDTVSAVLSRLSFQTGALSLQDL